MQVNQFLMLLLCLNLFRLGKVSDTYYSAPINIEKNQYEPTKEPCEIDRYYDSLIGLKIDNILLYKELGTPSGNKGLIIWKKKNCVFGVKFNESVIEGCKKEEVNPNSQNLGLIALKFFYGGEKDYSVTKSRIEAMHDFKIEIRSVVNGKEMKSEFFDSATGNKSEFLPEISRLCQDIIYGYEKENNEKNRQ